jgi:hypothetical protein
VGRGWIAAGVGTVCCAACAVGTGGREKNINKK